MDAPSTSSSNRGLLWLIFGALMLIAGLQTEPYSRSFRELLGIFCLAVAGLVFATRFLMALFKHAADEIPSPLTDRANKNNEASASTSEGK